MLERARKSAPNLEFSSAKAIAAATLGPESSAFRHSLKVAWAARTLAMELQKAGIEIDPDDVGTQAVLHDVGRGDEHSDLHGWEGYQLLRSMGYQDQARACLTHWLRGRSLDQALSESRPKHHEALKAIYREVGSLEMTLSDKVIALADSLAAGDKLVTIEERYREARGRYGRSRWLLTGERMAQEYLAEMKRLSGADVYKLFGLNSKEQADE